MDMTPKARNKDLFDYLYSRKEQIENTAGFKFEWDRRDDIKTSKIYASIEDLGVADEGNWSQVAEFHTKGCKSILDAFGEHLQEYFS
jgi:hypothetical protein